VHQRLLAQVRQGVTARCREAEGIGGRSTTAAGRSGSRESGSATRTTAATTATLTSGFARLSNEVLKNWLSPNLRNKPVKTFSKSN